MISRITKVDLELSSLCNASCPQCLRNHQGGAVIPSLPLGYLSRQDVEAIFTPALLAELEAVKVCGNYGDGATAPDAIESFEFLKERRPGLKIELHTNGGVREPAWWRRLAGTIDSCIFGIDGLEDTNHLYRRGVSWPKLMRNVEAYLAGGGAAEWQFLVFRHNEHQIEEARALAASLGFRQFFARRTHRFLKAGAKGGTLEDRQAVLNRAGEVEYYLELPLAPEASNPAMRKLAEEVGAGGAFGTYSDYLESTPIVCKAIERRQVYISAEGLVFPCCWTGGIYRRKSRNQVRELLESTPGGKDAINAKRSPVEEIVRGEFFRGIAESWSRPRIEEGRLATCARHCGQCDMADAQRSPAAGLAASPSGVGAG